MMEGQAMNPGPPSIRTVTIVVVTVPCEGLARMPCQSCQTALDLCQPDSNLPDRFLATCPECGEWFVVDTSDQVETARLTSLAPIANMDAKPVPIRPRPRPS
jgi:hypothetical protein